MKRNRVLNAIAEYDRRFMNTKEGQFDLDDVFDCINAAETTDYADSTIQALKAGFIIGYHKGKKEGRCKA